MGVGDMTHELGVTEPAIGHHHRWGQGHAAFGKGGQAFIEHLLVRFSLSWHLRPGPLGLGRRMAKSTGMMSLPSPMTTSKSTPSMPKTGRLNWPLYQRPTSRKRW